MMKVFNLAGTIDLLRELVYRQTGTSSSLSSIRILQKLTTSTSGMIPPRQVRHNAINTVVIRLSRQLEDGNRRDRSTRNVRKWCSKRSNAGTAVTKLIGNYFLDMKLISPPERLKFAQACVLCLHPYCGNRLSFDVADAMWRMLQTLKLDLAMSKECRVDLVFQYWHGKNIYFKLVRKIAMQVEKRLMDMRRVLAEEEEGN